MYYLALVQNNDTQALFAYNTLDDALTRYHSELAYRGEGRTSTKCAILDENLMVIRNESYSAPVQAVEEPLEG